jgi:hypothetical protein
MLFIRLAARSDLQDKETEVEVHRLRLAHDKRAAVLVQALVDVVRAPLRLLGGVGQLGADPALRVLCRAPLSVVHVRLHLRPHMADGVCWLRYLIVAAYPSVWFCCHRHPFFRQAYIPTLRLLLLHPHRSMQSHRPELVTLVLSTGEGARLAEDRRLRRDNGAAVEEGPDEEAGTVEDGRELGAQVLCLLVQQRLAQHALLVRRVRRHQLVHVARLRRRRPRVWGGALNAARSRRAQLQHFIRATVVWADAH